MKQFLISLSVTLCLCFLSCDFSSKKNNHTYTLESDGRLQVKDSRYILGEVLKSKGDSIEFIFNLKNCADSLIIIKKVDVSCGCISIIESPDSIFPNMNAKLKGVVNIKNQHGHLNKSIFVNYGRNSILLLRIIGDIIE